ncbi:sn-glycerol-3-phosphate ABC transporter ATP-binding protein UgpC [Acuticoccus sp. M5D2P5]|uniref:ABC transporter ATP-binding protein n=1 Tax=Acuticoccus kalidii TaxID=2910977 RepID=UPI001F397605|nr:sn-glycerol-3-phosphate ABC transporter ATP-binding protein UgpC [Acuticoccus kalidii]MCF3935852.1 sn-glycerol-3-phosphate ABC transporter ATP-binding protein UgpC [Acuticoccus kalidii]
MAHVEINDVRKAFGTAEVLHGISANITDGEFVVLVGPSGCGKSTLLRMIAGLEDITSGEMFIDGVRVNDIAPKDRDIAMVFQNYALYPHMTVAENLGFSLRLRGQSRKIIRAEVARAAEILQLTPLLDRQPRQLSGGQRQRVAMGRALVRNPKVFLFDEPLSNLDAKLRVEMRAEIKALHANLRTTMIYVTHDQIEAMTMADKIVVMRDGYVEQIGAPLELFDSPANMFVAGFLGSPAMNFLNSSAASHVFRLTDGIIDPAMNPDQIVLGVRPEHFFIEDSPDAAHGPVTGVENTGSETQVSIDLFGQNVVAIFHRRIDVFPGDQLPLRIDPAHVHVFNQSNGQRLDLRQS